MLFIPRSIGPAGSAFARRLQIRPCVLALLVLVAGLGSASAHDEFKVLVFSKTAAFRHASITNGIQLIQALGVTHHFAVDATENAAAFTDANLAQYAAVVFLSTTGDILDGAQQGAFERYIQAGGGFVGIHSASDTEYSWPWYGQLVGAYFNNHPAVQTATTLVCDRVHPSTAGLPERWVRTDEWYNFQGNPRGTVHVLATLDEGSYNPGAGAMGHDHPIAWCRNFDGGRSWYTGGGHTTASYSEPLFQQHILGGIQWAAGAVEGDAGATLDSNYQKVVLDSSPSNPMELSIAPDGRVFYAERGGGVKIWKPDTQITVLAGTVSVFSQLEDGLLGITLDPGFATNNWIYLFYSPSGATPKQHISRFTMTGDTLDMASEKILLVIPTQRDQCCHSGGSLAFGPDGSLFISTGDNTNPFDSSGYAPIDEQAGREPWDAQKSSSNANDLRGKILRIRPQADGTYTIPAGNLFAPGTPGTRPEIYIMGCRNPFRMSIDPATGWVYWGEVGPDANSDNANRGPKGHDEWNQARAAGNFGWPYLVADNKAYRDYDFATSTPGAYFDAAMPTNQSPNNTGPQVLPPAQPAWIWYADGASTEFPQLDSGNLNSRTAMGGPVYHFSSNYLSARRLPPYFDGTLFIYEWSRNFIREVKLDSNGDILAINPFLPTFSFQRPMDMEVGPDGAIYMIEWGTGFNGNNSDAQVIRIDYVGGNRVPVAVATATPDSGTAPLLVQFSSAGSHDPDPGDTIHFAWSFFGDGATNSTAPNPSFSYPTNGTFAPRLVVYDSEGNSSVVNLSVVVGNNRPVPSFDFPPNGAVFGWGDRIDFSAAVFDTEDGSTTNGSIPCSQLSVELTVGHDDHGHGIGQVNDCTGFFLSPPGHGDEADNIFLVLLATYTDGGGSGAPPLSGAATTLIHPRRKQAQYYNNANGISTYLTSDVDGVLEVADIDHGDWIRFAPYNFLNLTGATFRVASPGPGGQIELRLGATNGTLLTTATVPPTGGAYTEVSTGFTDPGGTHDLFLVFTATPGATDLYRLNWMEFSGAGAGVPLPPDTNPPVITLERPVNGVSFLEGQTIPMVAHVTDDVLVSSVDLLVNGAVQSSPTAPPYTLLTPGLTSGAHSFSVQAEDVSGNRATNTALVTVTTGTLPKGPYGGAAHFLPGRIESEDFDQGGQDVGYFESDAIGNQGNTYRTTEGVDIQATQDPQGGNFNVGWTRNGEWLEYTVTAISGTYDIHLRTATQTADPGDVAVTLNGQPLGTFVIPNTFNWQTWTNTTLGNVAIPGVTNAALRLTLGNGATGFLHNMNWIEFVALTTNYPPPVLEWTPGLSSPFTEATSAVVNTNTRTITTPLVNDQGYYRIRADYPIHILGVQLQSTNVVLQYE